MIVSRSLAAKILGLGLLLVSPASLANEEAAKPFVGVWGGTLGEQAITACFNAGRRNFGTGSYYYQRYLLPIRLALQKDAKAMDRGAIWKEEKGTWHVEDVTPSALLGVWTSLDGSRSLPIKLERVVQPAPPPNSDSDFDYEGCGSDAYNEVLEASPKIIIGAIRSIGNIQYRKVFVNLGRPEHVVKTDTTGLYMDAMEFMGNSSVITAINEYIHQYASVKNLFWCRRMHLNGDGDDGQQRQVVWFDLIGHWLKIGVQIHENCSAYAYGNIAETGRIWNLATGEQEDMYSWLQHEKLADDNDASADSLGSLPPKLNELIESRFGQGLHFGKKDLAYCYGEGPYNYEITLTEQGINFDLPLTKNGSCGDSFAFTFAELAPFLNEKGRKAVAAIKKSQKSPKRAATGKGNM